MVVLLIRRVDAEHEDGDDAAHEDERADDRVYFSTAETAFQF